MSKRTIVICSSATFYEHVNEIAEQLSALGMNVVVPATAAKMKLSGDYNLEKVKVWLKDSNKFYGKAALMRGHFDAITAGDAILVVNDNKHGIEGYIGPNVLMEMGLAFYQNKPIYLLNDYDKSMPLYEEVEGVGSIIIKGDIGKIK